MHGNYYYYFLKLRSSVYQITIPLRGYSSTYQLRPSQLRYCLVAFSCVSANAHTLGDSLHNPAHTSDRKGTSQLCLTSALGQEDESKQLQDEFKRFPKGKMKTFQSQHKLFLRTNSQKEILFAISPLTCGGEGLLHTSSYSPCPQLINDPCYSGAFCPDLFLHLV